MYYYIVMDQVARETYFGYKNKNPAWEKVIHFPCKYFND